MRDYTDSRSVRGARFPKATLLMRVQVPMTMIGKVKAAYCA